MSRNLYLECYSGISGDMMVAALLDLGADQEVLNKALQSLPVKGFKTEISRVPKSGLDVCDFNVLLDSAYENHDHDMGFLYGEKNVHESGYHPEVVPVNVHIHSHEGDQEHIHSHEDYEEHNHEEMHQHSHVEMHPMHNRESYHEHIHQHEHRGLAEILEIIEQADLSKHAKDLSITIFNILANAEAKAHGVEKSKVHFHEVGAVDSIVDIISAAVCFDNLGIDEVIVPVLYEGTGFVRCQHGMIPVPVPAVANIVSDHGLKLSITNSAGEYVTPTGAAIVAAMKTSDKLPEAFSIEKTGYGAGKRDNERPGILRAMLIQA